MAATLKRPERSQQERERQKGKPGAPWKRGTRDAGNTSVEDAYRDIRLEERFFLGNTIGGMRTRRFERPQDMRVYQPTRDEAQRGREPKAFAEMENEFGRIEMGMDRKREFFTMAVGQKTDADRLTLPRHRGTLRGDNATPVRGTVGERGMALASTFEPEQSAIAVRTRASRGYRDALSILSELKARGGSETIEEVMPFLSNREEREEETRLSQAIQGLDPQQRQAAELRLNHVRRMRVLKSQRRMEFLQRTNVSLQEARTRPQVEEQERKTSLLDRILARLFQGSADGGEPLDAAWLVRQFTTGGVSSPRQLVDRLLDRFSDSLETGRQDWEDMLAEQQNGASQMDAGNLILQMIIAEILRQIAERIAKRKEGEENAETPPENADHPPEDTEKPTEDAETPTQGADPKQEDAGEPEPEE